MTHPVTCSRRNAIRRAAAAVVQLARQPAHHSAARAHDIDRDIPGHAATAARREATRQNSRIVNDVEGHCDRQAWAAVFALENLAAQLVDHDTHDRQDETGTGEDCSAGGQAVAGEIDPLDIACEECGAEPAEECGPLCIASWQHRPDFPAFTHIGGTPHPGHVAAAGGGTR